MPPPKPLLSSADEIERQFYDAIGHADVDRLMSLWSNDDAVVCVHPGGRRFVGLAAIRASFEAIFSNGPIDASPERVRRIVTDDCAIHSVVERVSVASTQGPQSAWVLATNVYLRTTRGWRLVAHHASPGSTTEIQEIGDSPTILH